MKKLLISTAMLVIPFMAAADELTEDRIKELVLEAIRENPGIVFEAAQLFEEQQQANQALVAAQVLATEREALERDPNAPVLGNPDGDVTVVEFFDYNCPYCRRVKPHMEACLRQTRMYVWSTVSGRFWAKGQSLRHALHWHRATKANMKSFTGQ